MTPPDLLVLGAGATGLAAARAARQQGRSVTLVEADLPGGDCTFSGCIPSKTLLDLAHRTAAAREAGRWGVPTVGDVDVAAVLRRVREVVATIAQDESAAQLSVEGIQLVRGHARFTGPRRVAVGGQELAARRVVLAVGATATVPPLPGLDEVGWLDNRSVFELTRRPEHLLVMGGGPVGVELAQAFAQLGSRVTLLESGARILSKEEPEASAVLAQVLQQDGVDVRTGAEVQRVAPGPTLHLADGGVVSGSHLLLAVGRTPATATLGLDEAGVQVGGRAEVLTDGYLRTTVDGVFAAGDCTSPLQFTHVGDEQGRLAAGNAFARGPRLPGLLGGASAFDDRVLPWATFTDPEVGRVGMTEQQAHAAYGERARVSVVRLDEMDRTRTTARTDGYLKLIAGPRRLAPHTALDRVVGLTAVMPRGGELAATAAVAMRTGMVVGRLAQTVLPYPSFSLGLRMAAARLYGEYGGATWRPARPDS